MMQSKSTINVQLRSQLFNSRFVSYFLSDISFPLFSNRLSCLSVASRLQMCIIVSWSWRVSFGALSNIEYGFV